MAAMIVLSGNLVFITNQKRRLRSGGAAAARGGVDVFFTFPSGAARENNHPPTPTPRTALGSFERELQIAKLDVIIRDVIGVEDVLQAFRPRTCSCVFVRVF